MFSVAELIHFYALQYWRTIRYIIITKEFYLLMIEENYPIFIFLLFFFHFIISHTFSIYFLSVLTSAEFKGIILVLLVFYLYWLFVCLSNLTSKACKSLVLILQHCSSWAICSLMATDNNTSNVSSNYSLILNLTNSYYVLLSYLLIFSFSLAWFKAAIVCCLPRSQSEQIIISLHSSLIMVCTVCYSISYILIT